MQFCRGRARGLTFGFTLVSVLAPAAHALAASPPPRADIASTAGAWDLAIEGSHRKCRVTLGVEAAFTGHTLRFPAGCRRALPVLARASGWTADKGQVRLLDSEGRIVLEFEQAPRARKGCAPEPFRAQPHQPTDLGLHYRVSDARATIAEKRPMDATSLRFAWPP
jgi:hypothetical protein